MPNSYTLNKRMNQKMKEGQHKLQPGECLDLDNEGETGQAMCNVGGEVDEMQVAEAELNGYDIVNDD